MKQRPRFHSPSANRQLLGRLLGVGAVALALVAPGRALAQADITPPPPNVLLLVDTSGSMDYKSGSNAFPTCFWSGTTPTGATISERSRWIDLVEVLTGTIGGYQCQRLDRNSSLFTTEYGLGSQPPYDFLYPNPYIRPASNGCVTGPGTLSGNQFPAGYFKAHDFNNLGSTCTTDQAADGVLDSFEKDVRFGLMTFDTEVNSDTDVDGLWSYYVGSPTQGQLPACTAVAQEVGVRNPTAPPWEGRAVGFGNPAAGSTDFQTRNAWIQNVLLMTRPYGATPIAGMLDDARTYMFDDEQDDPVDSSFAFGPKADPAMACRRRAIILLSDGQPNLDMRPFCEPNPGGCPYDKSETIAADLRARGIDLFVIGFALTQVEVGGVEKSCSELTDQDLDASDPNSACEMETSNTALQACCSLNRIAAAGGHVKRVGDDLDVDWTRARFADDREELRAALSQAIGSNFPATTRTASVAATGAGFVGGDADLDFARGFRFGAAFTPGKAGQGWIGGLSRSRYRCTDEDDDGKLEPTLQASKPLEGDDFVANVNHSGPDERILFTVESSSSLTSTLRPNLASVVDGAGTNTATLEQADHSAIAFVNNVEPAAMGLTDATCVYGGVALTAAQCRDRVLKWLVGLDNGTANRRYNPDTGAFNLVGDFFHSAPKAVAGRPNALLNDKSYDAFVTAQASRPSVLYASSNDGFLHAFKMAPLTSDPGEEMSTRTMDTNELWAFVPPAVLPHVRSSYPGSRVQLLDGTPAIKDVVATYNGSASGYKYTLERSKGDAESGAGTWRTILVQSFGEQFPGYFALDVTDPVVDGEGGPKFLWQLVTDSAGGQLFGSGGGTPLITTVFIDTGSGPAEVAVAVLPGGYGSAADSPPATESDNCSRQADLTTFPVGYKPRTYVPCYSNPDGTAQRARSLTVVRLDNGKILRTFRKVASEVPTLAANSVVTVTPLDSPLTGQPVAFPSEVGTVADRLFIGDQDGTLWRLNFASTGSPADWKMDLFFDTYPGDGDFEHKAYDGQPIITPPIISVDALGNLTVAVSTGDQTTVGAAPGLANYVWSLVEKPNADRSQLTAEPQWHLDFKAPDNSGFRVIGSMALFAGKLYFVAMSGPAANADACAVGQGRIYAMDYLKPHKSGTAGMGGLVDPDFIGNDTDDYMPASTLVGSAEAFLGGVSIGQQPTCENESTTGDDAYFAFGQHQGLGTPTTGKFQLFISTGSAPTTSDRDDITPVDQGGANAAAIDLANPPVTTRIDSWASIVE